MTRLLPIFWRRWRIGLIALVSLGCLAYLAVLWLAPHGTPHVSGPDLSRLTRGQIHDEYPRWSPDGTKIAFQRGVLARPPGGVIPSTVEIWILELGQTKATQLTHSAEHSGAFYPSWSPDAGRIAYVEIDFQHTSYALCMIDSNGTHIARLYECPCPCHFPEWSPDGTQLLFVMPDSKGDVGRLYTVDVNQADEAVPINAGRLDRIKTARWSPDGQFIVAWEFPAGIWMIPLASGSPSRIDLLAGGEPTLSPDGRLLAFTAWGRWYAGSALERDMVYLAAQDSAGARPVLTETQESTLGQPDWSPDGKSLAVRAGEGGGVTHLYLISVREAVQP